MAIWKVGSQTINFLKNHLNNILKSKNHFWLSGLIHQGEKKNESHNYYWKFSIWMKNEKVIIPRNYIVLICNFKFFWNLGSFENLPFGCSHCVNM